MECSRAYYSSLVRGCIASHWKPVPRSLSARKTKRTRMGRSRVYRNIMNNNALTRTFTFFHVSSCKWLCDSAETCLFPASMMTTHVTAWSLPWQRPVATLPACHPAAVRLWCRTRCSGPPLRTRRRQCRPLCTECTPTLGVSPMCLLWYTANNREQGGCIKHIGSSWP